MSIASVISRPLKPSCLRSRPVMIAGIERRGNGRGIERRDETVKGHDSLNARGDRATERNELDGVDPRAARMDRGDREMRILFGVAMPGKVFSRGQHPVFLQAVDQRRAHVGDEARILAERSHPDDRIRGIVVDVEHRREGDVHAQRASLERGDASLLVGERACRALRRVAICVREHRGAAEIDVVRQEVAAALSDARRRSRSPRRTRGAAR